MKLVLITPENSLADEWAVINHAFELGIDNLYIRKPKDNLFSFQEYLNKIPLQYLYKVVIPYAVAKGLNVANEIGFNLKEEDLGVVNVLRNKGRRISASFHTLDSIKKWEREIDWCFLSPVFDSISKKGYSATFEMGNLQKHLVHIKDCDVIGLGGVRAENITQLIDTGFDGCAVLGSIWEKERTEDKIDALERVINKRNLLENRVVH